MNNNIHIKAQIPSELLIQYACRKDDIANIDLKQSFLMFINKSARSLENHLLDYIKDKKVDVLVTVSEKSKGMVVKADNDKMKWLTSEMIYGYLEQIGECIFYKNDNHYSKTLNQLTETDFMIGTVFCSLV